MVVKHSVGTLHLLCRRHELAAVFSALLEYRDGQGLSRRGNKERYALLVLVGCPDTKARQRCTGVG